MILIPSGGLISSGGLGPVQALRWWDAADVAAEFAIRNGHTEVALALHWWLAGFGWVVIDQLHNNRKAIQWQS